MNQKIKTAPKWEHSIEQRKSIQYLQYNALQHTGDFKALSKDSVNAIRQHCKTSPDN